MAWNRTPLREANDTHPIGILWQINGFKCLDTNHFFYMTFCLFVCLRQGLIMQPKLALNSWSTCLSLLSARITDMHHHIQQMSCHCLFLAGLGIKPWTLCMLGKLPNTDPHPQPFVWSFLIFALWLEILQWSWDFNKIFTFSNYMLVNFYFYLYILHPQISKPVSN
jgi:hypothetical protein